MPPVCSFIKLNKQHCLSILEDKETLIEGSNCLIKEELIEYRLECDESIHVVFEADRDMCNVRKYYKRFGDKSWKMSTSGVCLYGFESLRIWDLIEEALPYMVDQVKRVLVSKRKRILPEPSVAKYFNCG